ncbi:MAG: T9SS type A sorting domain-containing protein [Bacteroidales bacterium]|nr:T9SS type A sorting domain-containing protein [Bacteroidales bacterium]
MKRLLFTSIFLLALYIGTQAQTTHTISISGLSFSPSSLNISVGDKVQFNGSSSHPIAEVSEETWNANSNTPLAGGFSFPSGLGEKTFNMVGTYYYICENHYSSGMKGKITVSAVTALEDIPESIELKIFPNPLDKDYLTISLNRNPISTLEITIFDITGSSKIVKSNNLDKDQIIDCSDLLSGIYIVQINMDNNISSTKLVKR